MADHVTVETSVIGGEDVNRLFTSAGSSVRDRIRAALFALGEEVRDAAQAGAPRLTGALQRSIKAKLKESANEIAVTVAPGKFYARFLEYGTVNHGTVGNRSLGGSKFGKVSRVRSLRAAGMYRISPRPFMGPAQDGVRGRVHAALEAAIGEGLTDAGG